MRPLVLLLVSVTACATGCSKPAPVVQTPADAAAQPTARGSYLRWNFDEGYVPEDSPNQTYCHAKSVSWLDAADALMWTTALPKRMFDADEELCECRRVDDGGPCAAEVQYYLQNPREYRLRFVFGTHELASTVITADETGILALSKKDGALSLDRALPFDSENRFFVDEGRYAIEGDSSCSGDQVHGQFFVRCGARLLYFNGTTAALIDAEDLSVDAVGTFDETPDPASKLPFNTRIKLGAEWLKVEGHVWM